MKNFTLGASPFARCGQLVRLIAMVASVNALPAAVTASPGSENPPIQVANYGALPDDGKDDTQAILRAAEALRSSGAHELAFRPGRYDLHEASADGDNAFLTFEGIQAITISGNGALLEFSARVTPFVFKKCADVKINNLTIDWQRPFFLQGRVVRTSGFEIEVEIDERFPVQGDERFETILDYDENSRLPLANLDILSATAMVSQTRLASGRYLLTLREPEVPKQREYFLHAIKKLGGRLLVLRTVVYGNYGIDFIDCRDVVAEGIGIFTVPGKIEVLPPATSARGSIFQSDAYGLLAFASEPPGT